MGFEPQTFRPTVWLANDCATGAGVKTSGPVCFTVHEHLIVGIRIWVVIPSSFFGLVFCCHCMLSNVSLRFVPTRHRVQQGDAHERKLQQVSTRAQNAIYSDDKNPKFTLSRCLPSTTNRLIGSGQPSHPSRRSPGGRSCVADKYSRMAG